MKKIQLIEWLARLQDEGVIEQIDRLRVESADKSYSLRMPKTEVDLDEKLNRAEEGIRDGKLYTQSQAEDLIRKKFNK